MDKTVKRVLIVASLTIPVGCGRQEISAPSAQAHGHTPVVIARDGKLSFAGKSMTDADLVKMVEDRNDYRSSLYTNQTGVPLIDATILIEPAPETPYGRVHEIKDLILNHGGNPTERYTPQKSPTTN